MKNKYVSFGENIRLQNPRDKPPCYLFLTSMAEAYVYRSFRVIVK